MDLRRLKTFVTVAEHGTVSKAADVLHITQPALSTAIKQLEQAFGVVLFNRNTREVALTDLGAAWLPQVQQALSGVDAVVAAFDVALGRVLKELVGWTVRTGETAGAQTVTAA